MSPDTTTFCEATSGATAGCFVFVVGPSGAGKDTILRKSRDLLVDDPRIVFLHRTVTRPSDRWETNVSVTAEEFDRAARTGAFALWWEAHNLRYGVPIDAIDLVRDGRIVICNGSRAAIPDALSVFTRVSLVLVTASREVRLNRLRMRGRESAVEQRADRLAEEDYTSIADIVIENDGDVDAPVGKLVHFLQGLGRSR